MRPVCLLMIFLLYTLLLPHNLIKEKLIDLIARNDRNAFILQKNLKNIMHGRVKIFVMG